MGVELSILSSATASGTTPPPGIADAILAQNGGAGQRNIPGIAESLSRLSAQNPQQGAAARSQIEAKLSPVERGQLAANLPVHATLPNGKGIDFGPNGMDADSWINLVRSTPQFRDTYKGLVQVAGGDESNAALKGALQKLHDSGMSVRQYLAANPRPAAAASGSASVGAGASASGSASADTGGWKASVAHFLDGTSLAGKLEDAAQPYLAKAGHAVGLDRVPGVGAWAQKALDTPGTFKQFREGAIEGVLDGGESLVTGTASLIGKTAQYAEDIGPAGYAGDLLRGQLGKSLPGALDAVLPSASRGSQTSDAIGNTALSVGKYVVSRAGRDDLVAEDVINLGGKLVDRATSSFTQAGEQGGVGAQMRLLGKFDGRASFEVGSLVVGGGVTKLGTAAKLVEGGEILNDVAKGGEVVGTVNDATKAERVVATGADGANAAEKTTEAASTGQTLAAETTTTTRTSGRNVVQYTLDAEGNTLSAKGTLVEDFGGGTRSSAEVQAQSDAAARGVAGDQGGHLAAYRFMPEQGPINLFPQEGNFNMSAFKTLENDYARYVDAGHKVDFEHTLGNFDSLTGRPGTVDVGFTVRDKSGSVLDSFSQTFKNEAGQVYTRRAH